MDKLRRLVAKVQKAHHPYGQGILSLTYNIWKCEEKYLGYVQQSGTTQFYLVFFINHLIKSYIIFL